MDSRRARIWLAVCVLLTVLVSGCGKPATAPPPPPGADDQDRCPLDGTVLYRKGDVTRRTLAVIIDNDPAAWPVSGLGRACLVYELPVEGGLTRFVAFYHHQDAALTGPVRSARSYFVPLVQENDAILAHVGGSVEALARIEATGVDHFDELTLTEPFWQGANRQRPYSTFTNTDQMRTAAVKAGLRGSGNEKPVAVFSEEKPFSADPAQGGLATKPAPTIAFGAGPRAISYRYDSVDGAYRRYLGDSGQRDGATGGGISVKTLVVLYLKAKASDAGPEGIVRADDLPVGQGKALYYSGGVGVAGTWRKAAAADRTELLDSAGKPIVFRPGQIWVHYVYSDAIVVPDLTTK